MNDEKSSEAAFSDEDARQMERRLFLKSLGKWSGAAITAAVGGAWLASGPRAAGWINRRVGGAVRVRGGAWVNRSGWVNAGGGWINRVGGGGAWVNRRGHGGGRWINRR